MAARRRLARFACRGGRLRLRPLRERPCRRNARRSRRRRDDGGHRVRSARSRRGARRRLEGDRPCPPRAHRSLPALRGARPPPPGASVSAPRLFAGPDRIAGLLAEPGRLRHRDEGDVRLCVPVRRLRRGPATDRGDPVHHRLRPPVVPRDRGGRGQGLGGGERHDGVALRERGGGRGDHRHGDDPADAEHRVQRPRRRRDHRGGELGGGARPPP